MSQSPNLQIQEQFLKYAPFTEKLWGGEYLLCNNALYCSKILALKYGFQSSFHYHNYKDEEFHILDGLVYLELVDKSTGLRRIREMSVGDRQRLFPKTPHRFWSGVDGALVLELSTHDDPEDSIRLELSKERTHGIPSAP